VAGIRIDFKRLGNSMETYRLSDFKNGWVVGDFLPTIFKSKDMEVSVQSFSAGAPTRDHYHAKAIEINIVISGAMRVNEQNFSDGDIFVLNPYEISSSEFFKDTTIVIIKAPSVTGDKYEV
jgi:quercetin dioxygenase-like cupin family protein